jgi:hypothetical protein
MAVDQSDRPFRGFLPRKTTPRDLYQSTVIAKRSKGLNLKGGDDTAYR